jgi:23S rRNA (adenine2503-C2)-methyltransferase
MPYTVDTSEPARFFDLSIAAVGEVVREWGWPAYRGNQLLDWVYGKLVADPQQMSNLSRGDRQVLAERMVFTTADVTREQISSDGTIKLLLGYGEQRSIESVMIPDGPRRTVCVSSQFGCPVGCQFCASGLYGVQGNLSPGQIVQQVYFLNRMLQPNKERVNHVVFMGMGEPLANYANTISAVRILHDPRGFNMGARSITISTVGVPAKMRQLADEGIPVNLALSLHAPNERLRRELIPWAEHFGLDDILGAARYYFEKTGREITLEYILLSGVNDRPEHAGQLVSLCRALRANVNLIRYNEVPGLPFGRPKAEDVAAFQQILRQGGVNAHVRKSRGRDIDAACGQLRRREQVAGDGSHVV